VSMPTMARVLGQRDERSFLLQRAQPAMTGATSATAANIL